MVYGNELKSFAEYYYNLGLNVTCITNRSNPYNANSKRYKRASHQTDNFYNNRQTIEQFNSYDWENAIGIGTLCGQSFTFYNRNDFQLVTLDFDGINLYEIQIILSLLQLPKDYEWVVKTGSKLGYHIHILLGNSPIFDIAKEHNKIALSYNMTQLGEPYVYFDRLDILLNSHLVLPPSLHASGYNYEFINCDLASKLPLIVDGNAFLNFLYEYCDHDLLHVLSDVYFPGPRIMEEKFIEETNYLDLKYIVIDIETDGLVEKDIYPNILQISWYILNKYRVVINKESYSISNDYLKVNKAFNINKLDINILNIVGCTIEEALKKLVLSLRNCKIGVCYNKEFDLRILNHYLKKYGFDVEFDIENSYCVMNMYSSYKKTLNSINLETAYHERFFHGRNFITVNGHNAESDVYKTYKLFRKLPLQPSV